MSWDDDTNGDQCGLLIPIGILLIVFFATGIGWLFIPILVLVCVCVSGREQERKIQTKRREIDHWTAPEGDMTSPRFTTRPQRIDERPVYDRKKRKEENVELGILIPIFIIGWLFVVSRFSWVFAIPLFVLIASFLSRIISHYRGRGEVVKQLDSATGKTVSEIADSAGITQERARQHIVREKRKGTSSVWFDAATGKTIPSPVRIPEQHSQRSKGCSYCGFALKIDDRYCPNCGAPIMAES